MTQRSPLHKLRRHFATRRTRVERLTGHLVRAVGRAHIYAERHGSYATGRERALLGALQDLEHRAETLRRSLAEPDRSSESATGAIRTLCRAYDRILDVIRPLASDSRLVRELRRAGRPLRKLERAFAPAPPASRDPHGRGRRQKWSIAATAPSVATAEPPTHPG